MLTVSCNSSLSCTQSVDLAAAATIKISRFAQLAYITVLLIEAAKLHSPLPQSRCPLVRNLVFDHVLFRRRDGEGRAAPKRLGHRHLRRCETALAKTWKNRIVVCFRRSDAEWSNAAQGSAAVDAAMTEMARTCRSSRCRRRCS